MKAELILPPELIDEIVERLFQRLNPVLSNSDKREEDVIFDVQKLAEYLSVSNKWIYERTQFKEIPHQKVKGLLRFRKRDIDKWLDSYNVPAVSKPERILRAIK